MVEVREPLTPEAEATLRQLEAKHQRRYRLVALLMAVTTSAHITLILATTWHDWALDGRDLGCLIFFVWNGFFGTFWMLLGLRQLCADEAMARHWKLEDVRWQAEMRAWCQQQEERRRPREDASAR